MRVLVSRLCLAYVWLCVRCVGLQSRFSHREVLFTRPPFDGDQGMLRVLSSTLRLGPAVRNQSFSLAPAVAAFLSDRRCRAVLRRHHRLGRSVVWFQRVFALMIAGVEAADIQHCVLPTGATAAANTTANTNRARGGGGGGSGPFSVEALERAVARLNIDPLKMMVQDMSTPELVMLIAARHATQRTVGPGPLIGRCRVLVCDDAASITWSRASSKSSHHSKQIDSQNVGANVVACKQLVLFPIIAACARVCVCVRADSVNGGACLFSHAAAEYNRFLKDEERNGSQSASMENFTEAVL